MTVRDWFLFISTFVIAVLCGMYLYYTTFVPTYIANPVVQEIAAETAPNWTLAVRTYGGCAMSSDCPAFELTEKRNYRYQADSSATIESDKVPVGITRELSEVLEVSDLDRLSRATSPVESRACRSFVDGIDYSLSLVYYGETYELDTCRTQLPYDHELVQLARATFYYLEHPEEYVAPSSSGGDRGGVGGYLERLLDETFDYDEQ